jgi:predicted phage terminase large subunit-like protein
MVLMSMDCAFKDLETSDFVAIGAIGIKGPLRMILDIVNDHLDVDATELAAKRMRAEQMQLGRNVAAILVEDKANGPSVIKRLKRQIPGVIARDPQGGKVARMFAAAPEWHAGDWFVDRTAAWCEPFVQQITWFPGAAHDDMADMMSQASIYLQTSQHGVLAYWDDEIRKLKESQASEDHFTVQAEAQKAEMLDKLDRPADLIKPTTSELKGKETPSCPNCGNKALSRFAEGAWRCNACGTSGRDPGFERTMKK